MKHPGAVIAGGVVLAGIGAYAVWRVGQRQFAQAWAEGDEGRAKAVAIRQQRLWKVGQTTGQVAVVMLTALAAANAEQA